MIYTKKRIRLKDLSDILNISQTTISNALRGIETVNKRTRLKIIKAAEEYGYVLKIRGGNTFSIDQISEANVTKSHKSTIYDIAKILNIAPSTVSRALMDSVKVKDATKLKIKEVANAINYEIDKNAQSLITNRKYKDTKLTIYDIANKLNISPSTVSRSLNGKTTVAKKTSDRIRKISKELGYWADPDAVRLGKKKILTVSVFVAGFGKQVNSILEGIDAVAKSLKINLLINNSLALNPIKIKHISLLLKHADGIIVIPDPYNELGLLEKETLARFKPAISLGIQQKLEHMETITINPNQAIYDIAKYLISLKKGTFCYIDPMADSGSSERIDGLKRALVEHEILTENQIIIQGCNHVFSPNDLVEKILSAKFLPEAIIIVNCYLDEMALLRLKNAGFDTDSSIVFCEFNRGFSNKNISDKNTLVSYDFHDLGVKGMENIIARIIGDGGVEKAPTFAKHRFYHKAEQLAFNS